MLSEEVGRGREMRRVEPKGQEGGGKGRWCPGEGQLGWKEPRGVGLPCPPLLGDPGRWGR